ncbi:MAG: retroviral-like aspartic protease family protein [Woeseiaceae bacterium]
MTSMIRVVKPVLKILRAAALLALPGCASVLDLDNALAIAPYKIEDGGRIIVEARLNGHGPYDFVLDTGASISAVFNNVRDQLALEPVPGKSVIVHGAIASGKHPLLRIEQLQLGSAVWSDPRVVSLPGETEAGANVDGVLGVDFLRRYAIGFSVRDRVVRLYSPDVIADRSYRGWASVPLKAEAVGDSGAAFYFFDIEIEGWKIAAVFDLGAGFNMINWAGVESLGRTARALRMKVLLSGALESSHVLARIRAEEVTTAGIRWRNEEFSVGDIKIFETFKLNDKPAAILGAGLFTQRDFVIDFARNRLLVRVAMNEVNVPGNSGLSP